MAAEEIDEYADAVLSQVELIPHGRVSSYGEIAEIVGRRLGRGGPRQVAKVMRQYGAAVPWYRVARSDGTLAPEVANRQSQLLASEGVPVRNGRVPRAFRTR